MPHNGHQSGMTLVEMLVEALVVLPIMAIATVDLVRDGKRMTLSLSLR